MRSYLRQYVQASGQIRDPVRFTSWKIPPVPNGQEEWSNPEPKVARENSLLLSRIESWILELHSFHKFRIKRERFITHSANQVLCMYLLAQSLHTAHENLWT
jgi:hypothetical protein